MFIPTEFSRYSNKNVPYIEHSRRYGYTTTDGSDVPAIGSSSSKIRLNSSNQFRIFLSLMKQFSLKYYPTIPAAVLHTIAFAGVYLLFWARKVDALRFVWLNNFFPEFHLHISNFAISYILLSGVGFLWLLFGVEMKKIIWASLVVLGLNFIFEWGITLLNTPDLVDAYYGAGGVATSVIELYLIKVWGLHENTERQYIDK